jgi:phosphoribosylaminoimidazole carboxylase
LFEVYEMGAQCSVVTTEIEHVNTSALEALEKGGKVRVEPSSRTIRLIQDKFAQKVHLKARLVPVSDFFAVSSPDEVESAATEYGYPIMLKSRRLAYDGRGNFAVKNKTEISKAWNSRRGQGERTPR